MEWTPLKLINTTADFFKKKGIPSARLDAELLLADTLGCSRVQLYTRFDQPLTPEELAAYRALVQRRANREPVAYIRGHKEFWGIDFAVAPGVLIPRPDTERLVEEAVKLLGAKRKGEKQRKTLPWNLEVKDAPQATAGAEETEEVLPVIDVNADVDAQAEGQASAEGTATGSSGAAAVPTAPPGEGGSNDMEAGNTANVTREPLLVLDLCTGTGIIPICLALETGARALGVDIAPEALEVARKNASTHQVAGQVHFLQGDLTAPVPARFHGRIDLLTSNPPYIPNAAIDKLEPEVSRHEPRLALSGGADGLDFYRRIAREVNRLVKPGGWVLLEVGDEPQANAVKGLLAEQKLVGLEVLKDLAGQARVVKGQRPA